LAAAGVSLLGIAPTHAGEVIERVVASVDGEPILLSDVSLLGRVRGVSRELALEALIDEHLMVREARRLGLSLHDDEAAYQDLLGRRPDLAADPEFGPGLRRLARRQATILQYFDLRLLPLVRIGAEELRRAYEQEHAGADAPSFEAVEESLRERLTRRELDERIEEWVRDLRARAEIRYNPAVSREP
jgi:hypothetical protein